MITEPRPGFLALAPWVEAGDDFEQLREVGQQLKAGSGHPRENAYHTDLLHADLHLPPSRVQMPPTTAHEDALRAYLEGEADFAPPGLLRRAGWWPVALLAAGFVLITKLGRRR